MNRQECDVLNILMDGKARNQRETAEASGHSLGVVNRSLRVLTEEGYLDAAGSPTDKAREFCRERAPENAVILAAGFGMRMVPINMETPKALLEVRGEVLIERLIRQLREAGVERITVVAGFMKEQLEYLIDEFRVELAVNNEYNVKNNLHSLSRVIDQIGNTYIVPCDLWCARNPFASREMYSWYMVTDARDPGSEVRVNRKGELIRCARPEEGNAMVGIAYVTRRDAEALRRRVKEMCRESANDQSFWEAALYDRDRMTINAKVVPADSVVEINTYEQLRELDRRSNHLKSDALAAIAGALNAREEDIRDISVLKKGMTNRSFLFSCKGEKYIMRIPGEGTDQLINRRQEAEVYRTIAGRGLCDDVVYLNPDNGYKITKFLEGVRVCDPENESDLRRCMEKLRAFHAMKLRVDHAFDIFGQIDFYESLWQGAPSPYRDYAQTKRNVLSLRPYIDAHAGEWQLTHIDAVPDNFLFYEKDGREDLQLTDWEYSGMQDPHVDIAMFCIYSLYDKQQTDRLIDLYFEGGCEKATRAKIYCYVAACGLLWSNWCDFKRTLGVEFGEYSLRQYRYAKDFYRYALEEMEGEA